MPLPHNEDRQLVLAGRNFDLAVRNVYISCQVANPIGFQVSSCGIFTPLPNLAPEGAHTRNFSTNVRRREIRVCRRGRASKASCS